jgi:hypothetical protein
LFSFAIGEIAGPSAEVSAPNRVDVVAQDQIARDAHRLVGVSLGVADHEFELAAKDPALGVDLLDEHLRALHRLANETPGPDRITG